MHGAATCLVALGAAAAVLHDQRPLFISGTLVASAPKPCCSAEMPPMLGAAPGAAVALAAPVIVSPGVPMPNAKQLKA